MITKFLLIIISSLVYLAAHADAGLYNNPADPTSLQPDKAVIFYPGTTVIEGYQGNIRLGVSKDNSKEDKKALNAIMREAKERHEVISALAGITKTSEHFVMVNAGSFIGKKIREFKLKHNRLPSGGIVLHLKGNAPYKIPRTYQP